MIGSGFAVHGSHQVTERSNKHICQLRTSVGGDAQWHTMMFPEVVDRSSAVESFLHGMKGVIFCGHLKLCTLDHVPLASLYLKALMASAYDIHGMLYSCIARSWQCFLSMLLQLQ